MLPLRLFFGGSLSGPPLIGPLKVLREGLWTSTSGPLLKVEGDALIEEDLTVDETLLRYSGKCTPSDRWPPAQQTEREKKHNAGSNLEKIRRSIEFVWP